MVIEHENAVLFAVRDLGAPVALLISEDAKELTRRHVVMLLVDPHPDEFLKMHSLASSPPAATALPFSHIGG